MTPRCKVGKKGRHEINVLIPDTVDNPAVLFCSHCGQTKHVSLQQLPPADDIIAEVQRIVSN